MDSPKARSRWWQSKSRPQKGQRRKHLNKPFYNSKQWRVTRLAYISKLQARIWSQALNKRMIIADIVVTITDAQATYLLSLDHVPCETCLRLYCAGAYDKVNPGEELDHIDPLNPEDALKSKGWGSPLDEKNLQYLCRSHHSKKSNRDKKIIKLKT